VHARVELAAPFESSLPKQIDLLATRMAGGSTHLLSEGGDARPGSGDRTVLSAHPRTSPHSVCWHTAVMGTSGVAHLENVAAEVALSDEELRPCRPSASRAGDLGCGKTGSGCVSYTVRARRSASNPANFAGSSGTPPSARRAVP
jgi:hypothetical protein